MPKLLSTKLLLAVATSAVLAACGSGDHDVTTTAGGGTGTGTGTPVATTDVPQSAQDSVAGLLAYLNDLIANRTNSTSEPLTLGSITLPVSDTTEAAP